MGRSSPNLRLRVGGVSGLLFVMLQKVPGLAQVSRNFRSVMLGSVPRHQSEQKKPLSRVRMSEVVRIQSRSMAAAREATAVLTACRARETGPRVPASLEQRACQIAPMTWTRSRVQCCSRLALLWGLSMIQACGSSARRTAADRGGAVVPVRAAQAAHSQSIAGAASGQSKKA